VTINKDQQKPLIFAAFVLLGILALQVPFTKLRGAEVKFTLFDLFSPIAAGILTPLVGLGAVLTVLLGNFTLTGASLSFASLVRIITPLFAAWYFGSKTKLPALVSLLAIIAFNLHPVGRSVWYFSLFWYASCLKYRKLLRLYELE